MSVTVQITVHTAHGKGDAVANALRSEAADHLEGDVEMTADYCRGDKIKLLTDDVGLVARIARAAESSSCVVGSSRYV